VISNDFQTVYSKLNEIPINIANKIVSEKSNHGISPNAIWALDISPICKFILVYLASKLNPVEPVVDQYISFDLSDIVSETSCNQNMFNKTLNKLIKFGYIREIQYNQEYKYCLTLKIFNEYLIKLIQLENRNSMT
jgi:hypothetical protein